MSNIVHVEQSNRQFDLSPQTFEQALTFSKYLADSDLVPKDFKGKPANCLIAMQWGMELGLKPLQALQNLAVINGRPALWGDAVLAIVRSSPLCEYVNESDDGETATCRVKRKGEPEQVRTFSMDDARKAGLTGKQGPWTSYPRRMRQMRARAFALRDVFPDVLRGMPVAEELMDTTASGNERFMGQADVVQTSVITQQAQEAAPQLPLYTDDQTDANLPKWQAAIDKGRAPEDIINLISSKYTMSEQQKARVLSLKPTPPQPAEAPFVAEMEAAEAAEYQTGDTP